jgi:polysaccharide pyruvyl transferase WcaK-like protein
MLGPAYILLLAMLLARSLHTPYILIGQQIGPLDSWLSRWVFSIALKGASFIGVRDRSSESLLERLGVDPDKRMFTGDEGFYLPPIDGEKVEEYLREKSIPQGYIAVQFRLDANSPFHDRVADFARLYDDIAMSLGKPLVFVPFSYADCGDDRETHRLIAKAITVPHFLLDVEGNARFTKAIMAKASLAVGVANHFCAFAASVGVPTIGIHATPYMTQKLDGLVQGRPYVLSIPVSELDDHDRLVETIVAHANRYLGMKRVDYFNERPQGYDSWLAPITDQV